MGGSPGRYHKGQLTNTYQIEPPYIYIEYPDYVPPEISRNYKEACAIKDLSPNASATLSRRCMQGIIHDYFKVSKGNLFNEILAIKEKVHEEVFAAMNAMRELGNIGAHLKLKTSELSDTVDDQEAQTMLNVLELLIEDTYIARHERKEKYKKVVDSATSKNNPQSTPEK